MEQTAVQIARNAHTECIGITGEQKLTPHVDALGAEYRLVHELFEAQARLTPNDVAVVFESRSMTYAELNAKANQLARYLVRLGAGPDQLVGLCAERGLELIVGILGILKAGGAYVPLDPHYPADRLEYMLFDANPQLLVTQASARASLPSTGALHVVIDDEAAFRAESDTDLDPSLLGLTAKNLAYVMYTSGSTGKPKGVMVEHRNITRLFFSTQEWFDFGNRDVWTLFHSFAFDFSVWELWGALLYGGRIVVVPNLTARSPEDFYRLICEQGVTVLNQTPSAFAQLISAQQRNPSFRHGLRYVIFGGEALEPRMLRDWISSNPTEHPRLVNMYGITETTVHVTHRVVSTVEIEHPLGSQIGRPIPDLQAYLVSDDGNLAPEGSAAEMYVAGAGVARGYWNRPELTAERFRADPFATGISGRMYKTGDLGRRVPDGTFEYIGRNDNQVKIRGFRIELGEIEAQLASHAHVKEAAVMMREDALGDKRLVAYVTPALGDLSVIAEHGRSDVRENVVEQWRELYEQTYSTGIEGPSFIGWNSSYTGREIPEEEMREWLRSTLQRIRALRPQRVLEIGCGSGLLLQDLAPACATYRATDLSGEVIARLRAWIKNRQEFKHVELEQCSAMDLKSVPIGGFDTIILNSVVQYFPGLEYLRTMLRRAAGWLAPGGKLFVGDVRHFGLMELFHTAVQFERAGSEVNMSELRWRIARSLELEKELLIDPAFFMTLHGEIANLSRVDVLLKRGRTENELTRYRYDVVLQIGGVTEKHVVQETINCEFAAETALEACARLATKELRGFRLTGIRNRRLWQDLTTWQLVNSADGSCAVGILREAVRSANAQGDDPEELCGLAEKRGYEARIGWNSDSTEGAYDLECFTRDLAGVDHRGEEENRDLQSLPDASRRSSGQAYANDPCVGVFKRAVIPTLREHLVAKLPSHMVPSAFVILDRFPLTPNGKLDRKALPQPSIGVHFAKNYEAPRGELEELLAQIWRQLLAIDSIGREDNFFELGGHSFLVVQLIDRLRREGITADVQGVYDNPTLAGLAGVLGSHSERHFEVPRNAIPENCRVITPDMLSLIELNEIQIDRIATSVPGGTQNIQDIYPLAPLQEGMLFHHLLNERGGDVYVLVLLLSLSSKSLTERFVAALEQVIARHDILRTAILWEQLPRPVQVVYRRAQLPVTEFLLDPLRDPVEQLQERLERDSHRLELRLAPLMRLQIAVDARTGERYALMHLHHIAHDQASMDLMMSEVIARAVGRPYDLGPPAQYREHVAYASARVRAGDHQAFFRRMLSDIDEPTLAFGLASTHGDGSRIAEARGRVEEGLARRIRTQARAINVSVATLYHVAWALVVARASGRDDIVFGTVLLGRLQSTSSAQRMLGMFINTLPIRVRLRGDSILNLVHRTQVDIGHLLGHEQASLAAAQRCSGLTGSDPLFNTLLNFFRSAPELRGGGAASSGVRTLRSRQLTNYPITAWVDDQQDGFELTVQADLAVDSGRLLGCMITAIEAVVRALEVEPRRPALELSILPETERYEVIERFNATFTDYATDRLVHELFEEQVERIPHAIAVDQGGKAVTYAELNQRANHLAKWLSSQGVCTDQPVGICIGRSIGMAVALLAIMKAGAAYVPLDPNYPVERLRHMMQDASVRVVLTEADLLHVIPATESRVIVLDGADAFASAEENFAASPLGANADCLVYVIYTSGSTGRPKGTAMSHRAMVNLIEWHRKTLGRADGIRVLQFAALSFDVAFQEVFSTLCTGGTLVLIDEWARRDARLLTRLLCDSAIQRLFLPPVMLQSIAEYCKSVDLPPLSLRDVITAGEQLRITAEIVQLFRRLPKCQLHNHYGPTETHVVTSLTLPNDPSQWPSLPAIGTPISNSRIYVLDERGQAVPIGVTGEIYIGGVGLARGYLDKPELSAQRFRADPFGVSGGTRLYRTGDLGRWQADGTLQYLGRNDHQVKIRGFRIELAEVETQLASCEVVKDSVVMVREDVPGERRLVAYVIPESTAESAPELIAETLRAHLKSLLPDHMIPSAFVSLESFPLTPSGKLDRRSLPPPLLSAYAARDYEAPSGEPETTLARIWQELLHVERVGRADNFFELGGHSLLMVQLMERLREVGQSVQVRDIYANPKLADLARILTTHARSPQEAAPNRIPLDCEAITPEMVTLVKLDVAHVREIERIVPGGAKNIQDIYPLTPLQEGMLFHHLMSEQGGDTYVMPVLYALPSREGLDKFIEALQWVINRHDILRTAIVWKELPRPVQVVMRNAILPVSELPLEDSQDPVRQLKERMKPELQRLTLHDVPPMRLQIAVSDRGLGQQWYALLQLHHLVCDHESWDVMFAEISEYVLGRSGTLPEAMPYRNHVAQALANRREEEDEAFFRQKLGDLDEPTAPFGLLDVYGDGSRITGGHATLDAELCARLRTQAQRLGVSAATLFHAGWALVLSHTANRDDLVFGTVLLGRLHGRAGAQRTLGMFINTLPLRLRLRNVSAKDLVLQAHDELVHLVNHEQASLATAQRCSGVGTSRPLFTTLFNFRHSVVRTEAELAKATGATMLAIECWTNYPITFSIDDVGDCFELTADTDRRIDPQRVIGYFEVAIRSLVDALQHAPATLALGLRILPQEERYQLLRSFNATYAAYPDGLSVHELFEDRVRRTPHAPAVIYQNTRLSYAELNTRANQLAHHLVAKGVTIGESVAILMGRSLDMLVAQISVLKVGGVYVPLDTELPKERQHFVMNDCRARVIISDYEPSSGLERPGIVWINYSRESCEVLGSPTENLAVWGTGGAPAYIMYTSGSTGMPKGVVVAHRGISRLALNNGYARIEPSDCVVHGSNPAFDASTFEIWGTLLNGATVLIVPKAVLLDSQSLYEAIQEHHVTILWLSAGLFAQHASPLAAAFARLRYLMVGGDVIEPAVVRRAIGSGGPQHLLNAYGPTECTTFSTTYRIESLEENARTIPIGRPISNAQVYILDGRLQPVPMGAIGEIYIGGAGVALGYLNRPELTAERFMADPFDEGNGARLYKTGDLAKWRPDGNIEFIGRNDRQVKLRGFRVELGEIEAQLLRHPDLKEVAVTAWEDAAHEKKLVAYVVADLAGLKSSRRQGPEPFGAEIVTQWKTLYEETYSSGATGPSFVGWNSSYSGKPIPESEMQEWLDSVVERIRRLRPKRVLEIGCGVGLLVQHLAPQCAAYVGTDFSEAALTRLQQWLKDKEEFSHVTLLQRSATELQDLPAEEFDTVILNSVVQYFPDTEYLLNVLKEAVRLLRPGGKIFVGDVRNLALLPMFHSAVQLSRASATIRAGQLRRRIARAIAQDKELVLDGGFFRALPWRLQGVSGVTVQLKRGASHNELTRHRYDVVVTKGEQPSEDILQESLEWRALGASTAILEGELRNKRWHSVKLTSIPNGRLARERIAQHLIDTGDAQLSVGSLRTSLTEETADGIDPELLWSLASQYGYDIEVGVDAGDSPECFQVSLIDRSRLDCPQRVSSARPPESLKPWDAYCNNPLENTFRQHLVPALREYLSARLPEYMIPTAWIMQKQLPLNSNGKVDRRALPVPHDRPEEMGEYVAPTTDLERGLAEIWAQALRVDQVGVEDNFFELGGHSLLAIKVLSQMSQKVGGTLRVMDLYRGPTIRAIATRILGNVPGDSLIDLSQESQLDSEFTPHVQVSPSPAQNVLLTGSTGFVGRFLLAQLLKDTGAHIFCLVRASSELEANRRVTMTLQKWDLWSDEVRHRVTALAGDLGRPRFGIEHRTYDMLCSRLDSIYHCGTSMNHLESYEMAKPANVEGMRELLRTATRARQKLINYVSTLGIFSSSGAQERVIDEATSIDHEKHRHSQGYTGSKWVGEKILLNARERSIPCNIFRLGLVWADSQRGRYDELQGEYRLFKTCLMTGYGVAAYRYPMPPTPVDYVARAIVYLADRHRGGGGTFHISAAQEEMGGVFERCNRVAGTNLELLPAGEWVARMKEVHEGGVALPIMPLIEYYEHSGVFSTSATFDFSRTHRELENGDIPISASNTELFRLLMQNMTDTDPDLRIGRDRARGRVSDKVTQHISHA